MAKIGTEDIPVEKYSDTMPIHPSFSAGAKLIGRAPFRGRTGPFSGTLFGDGLDCTPKLRHAEFR